MKAKAGGSDPKCVLDAFMARRDMNETEIGRALLVRIKGIAEAHKTHLPHLTAGIGKRTTNRLRGNC